MKYEVRRNEVRSMKYEETKKRNGLRNLQTSDFRLQKGISLVITLLILSSILAIASGISLLLLQELKFSVEIKNSTLAFFAADTGIEKILWDIRKKDPQYNPVEGDQPYLNVFLSNGANFTVDITRVIVAPPKVEIKSSGLYQGVQRSVEITY